MAGKLADIITCAKFQDEIFRGYDFTGGRISHFPIDFCMGLTTVQRDCAACDEVCEHSISQTTCGSFTKFTTLDAVGRKDEQTRLTSFC